MANRNFTSLSQLEKYLQTQISKVLDTHVAPVVKESIQTAVSDVVYGAAPIGSPVSYDRRNLKGESLGSTEQMHHEVSGGVLTVTDDAPSSRPWNNGKSLAFNIEKGYANKDTWYSQSRPFLFGEDGAVGILKEDGSHIEALKDGLEEIFGIGNVIRS